MSLFSSPLPHFTFKPIDPPTQVCLPLMLEQRDPGDVEEQPLASRAGAVATSVFRKFVPCSRQHRVAPRLAVEQKSHLSVAQLLQKVMAKEQEVGFLKWLPPETVWDVCETLNRDSKAEKRLNAWIEDGVQRDACAEVEQQPLASRASAVAASALPRSAPCPSSHLVERQVDMEERDHLLTTYFLQGVMAKERESGFLKGLPRETLGELCRIVVQANEYKLKRILKAEERLDALIENWVRQDLLVLSQSRPSEYYPPFLYGEGPCQVSLSLLGEGADVL